VGKRAIEVDARFGGEEEETKMVTSKLDDTGPRRPPPDPDSVIAAAFKAAGLRVPELPIKVPGTSTYTNPG
jgi:hypothetical protein